MDSNRTTTLTTVTSYIRDLVELTKMRLGALVIFSSLVSLFVVSHGQAGWPLYVLLGLGGFLVSGASSALNEILEKDFDAVMERTKDRPVAAGRMSVSEALLYAGLMAAAGISLLVLINPLTAFLAALSMVLYSFVYTPMKRFSNLSVLLGAVPGALPLLIGGVAFHGSVTTDALYLFAVQFFWQFGHFWAIAWIADEDYKRAGFRLLPFEGNKDEKVGLMSVWSIIPMLGFSMLMFYGNMNNPLAAGIVLVLGLFFLYKAYRLYCDCDDRSARQLMFASFIYLPVVLLAYALNAL